MISVSFFLRKIMRLFKTGIAGTLCVMTAPIMAQTEFKAQKDFIDHIDECHWLTNDQKEIFKQLPPLDKYAKELIKEENAKIQDEKSINLEQAKSTAKKFYSKYLSYLPPEFLKIATSIIEKGEYIYSKERFPGAYGSCMVVIPHGMKNIDVTERINDELITYLDDILSGQSFIEEKEKQLEPIRKQYLNKNKITENFGIRVIYNNGIDLLLKIVHETAHVLDYAYRMKNGIYEKNVKGMNHESVSLFFELLARKELGQRLFSKDRLNELYREMIQHDYLRRIIKADYSLRDKIIEQVKKDWKSALDKMINYVDFVHNKTYDGTKEALDRITKGQKPVEPDEQEYIHNIGKAFNIITAISPAPKNIRNNLYHLTKYTTRPIRAETFKEYLQS